MDWVARLLAIMAKRNCNTYGPDLSVHEDEAARIAEMGLKLDKGRGVTDKQTEDGGPDASKSEIDKLEHRT